MKNRKEQMIAAAIAAPLKVGDKVNVRKSVFNAYARNPNDLELGEVTAILENGNVMVVEKQGSRPVEASASDVSKWTYDIGFNPLIVNDRIDKRAYSLSTILHSLGLVKDKSEYNIGGIPVAELNWNPFVYVDGIKKYYQRDLVWPLTFKQALIESIYYNVDCGQILVRKRGWKELEAMAKAGEKELAFKDIVDGKQRMNAINEFMNNEWADCNGYYYGELSKYAQQNFNSHQLFGYGELPENTPDRAVLRQFLKMNTQFFPQSLEHIDYVKGLYTNI